MSIREEAAAEGRVDVLAAAWPITWRDGLTKFLDIGKQEGDADLLAAESFKQDDICDHLSGIEMLRAYSDAMPIPDHRVDEIRQTVSTQPQRIYHLAQVLTPHGWHDTFRPVVLSMRDALLEAGRKADRGSPDRRTYVAAAAEADFFLKVLTGLESSGQAALAEMQRPLRRANG